MGSHVAQDAAIHAVCWLRALLALVLVVPLRLLLCMPCLLPHLLPRLCAPLLLLQQKCWWLGLLVRLACLLLLLLLPR